MGVQAELLFYMVDVIRFSFEQKGDRVAALVKCVEAKAVHVFRVQTGRPMSRCEPPGPEPPHQGVRVAGLVCCGAGRSRLT